MTKTAIAAGVATAAIIPVLGELPDQLALISLSGFFGGVTRWAALREPWWPDGTSSVLIGTTTAAFMWPLAVPLFAPVIGRVELEPASARMLGGYLTGLAGISIVGLFLDFIRAKRREQRRSDRDPLDR